MKEKNTQAKTPNKKAIGLTTKIFIALIAGAILGIVLCYLVPDSSFKKDVIIEGSLCHWTGIYPSDEDAGCTAGILLSGLRKYGNWRYKKTRYGGCENPGILSCNYSNGSLRCTWCR